MSTSHGSIPMALERFEASFDGMHIFGSVEP